MYACGAVQAEITEKNKGKNSVFSVDSVVRKQLVHYFIHSRAASRSGSLIKS
jgi:hypothetical protein